MKLLIMLMLTLAIKAGPKEPIPIENNGAFGVADPSGKVLVAPKYASVGLFSDGIAPFSSRGEDGAVTAGFLDRKGKPIGKVVFEVTREVHQGRAAVRTAGLWGYVDAKVKVVIPAKFERAHQFADARAWVDLGSNKSAIIDPTGKVVFTLDDYMTNDPSGFSEGLLVLVTKAKSTAVAVDVTGKVLFEYPTRGANAFSQGLSCFRDANDRWGFVDKAGKVVIEPTFAFVNLFSDGLAAAEQDGRWGFIDRTGKWAVQPMFADADPFSEGLARIRVGRLYGYVDKDGRTVISPIWEDAEHASSRFHRGMAVVGTRVDGVLQRGWIDSAGQPVWVPWPQ